MGLLLSEGLFDWGKGDLRIFGSFITGPLLASFDPAKGNSSGNRFVGFSVLSSDTVVITVVNRPHYTASGKYCTTEKLRPCKAVLQ